MKCFETKKGGWCAMGCVSEPKPDYETKENAKGETYKERKKGADGKPASVMKPRRAPMAYYAASEAEAKAGYEKTCKERGYQPDPSRKVEDCDAYKAAKKPEKAKD